MIWKIAWILILKFNSENERINIFFDCEFIDYIPNAWRLKYDLNYLYEFNEKLIVHFDLPYSSSNKDLQPHSHNIDNGHDNGHDNNQELN